MTPKDFARVVSGPLHTQPTINELEWHVKEAYREVIEGVLVIKNQTFERRAN